MIIEVVLGWTFADFVGARELHAGVAVAAEGPVEVIELDVAAFESVVKSILLHGLAFDK